MRYVNVTSVLRRLANAGRCGSQRTLDTKFADYIPRTAFFFPGQGAQTVGMAKVRRQQRRSRFQHSPVRASAPAPPAALSGALRRARRTWQPRCPRRRRCSTRRRRSWGTTCCRSAWRVRTPAAHRQTAPALGARGFGRMLRR